MTAIAYIRHSTAEQGERTSPALQRRAIEQYAAAQGQSVSAWFSDSKPGSTPITKRPGLRQAVEALHKGDTLIVYRLDRLYRDTEKWLGLERTVTKIGAKIVSTQGEGTNGFGDDDDPDAEYFRTMQAAQAQREVRVQGKRIRDGVRTLKEQGRRWNGTPPYGSRWRDTGRVTDKGRPIIEVAQNVAEQRTITLVRELRDQGTTFREIVAELKRRRRFNRAGNPFVIGQIQRILRRQ